MTTPHGRPGATDPHTPPAIGSSIGSRTVHLDRARLVRYAGASGDFNPIHYNERIAREVGLDDVIAHGMLTMAIAGTLVTDWVGDPGAVLDFQVRFTRPVLVPEPEGVDIELAGTVLSATGATATTPATATVDLTVAVGGRKVLGKARATVRLPRPRS